MNDKSNLGSLYTQARQALKAKDYDRASNLLRQILLIDENYRDVSRLLAQTVRLRRRRWYNDPRLWGIFGFSIIITLGVLLAPRLRGMYARQPSVTVMPTVSPTAASPTPTKTEIPTETPTPSPTQIPLAWKRVSMGNEFPRDTITTIAIDPGDADLVYVGTENAGIYKSIDGGLSWQPIHSGLTRAAINSILIASEDSRTLYAGVQGGVFKSTDGGDHWVDISPGGEMRDTPGYSHSLIMDAKNNRRLYYSQSDMLYTSQDGGASWIRLKTPCEVFGFEFELAESGEILLSRPEHTAQDAWLCNDHSLFKSTDNGQTWNSVTADLKGWWGWEIHAVHLAKRVMSDGRIDYYASVGRGGDDLDLFLSTDRGESWEQLFTTGCSAITSLSEEVYAYCSGVLYLLPSMERIGKFQEDAAKVIAISSSSPDTIFVGGDGWLYATRDGGVTWQRSDNGMGNTRMEMKSGWDSTLFVQDRSTIFGANSTFDFFCHLYRSTDHGVSWNLIMDQSMSCGLSVDLDDQSLYWNVQPGDLWSGSALKSIDNGETWASWGGWRKTGDVPFVTQYLIPDPFQPDRLHVIIPAEDGSGPPIMAHTTDGGNTWERSQVWAPEALRIFFASDPGHVMYGFGSNYGAYSSNSGKTWLSCRDTPDAIASTDTRLGIHPQDSNRLYLSTWGDGIQKSTDGCKSWKAANHGLGSLFVNTIAIDPRHGIVFAGTDGGAYVSFDDGETWNQISDGLLGATVVYSIVVDKESNVYAATPYGIFRLEGD